MASSLVPIAITDKILEAHIIKGRLEAAGIKVFIFDDQMLSTNWLYSEALGGGVRLMVLESQYAEAFDVLNESAAIQDFDAFDTCPMCQSTNIARLKLSLPLVLLSYFFLNFPYLRETLNRKCHACGHTWRSKQDS